MRGTDPYVPLHGDSRFRVTHYDLDLDYRPVTNSLSGKGRLSVEVLEDTAVLELDLVGLGVDKVTVDGRVPRRYRQRDGRVVVTLASVAVDGTRLELGVQWSGQPAPQRGPWGEVGWEELTDGVLVAGQPDGAPTWFPCNDRPGHKAVFTTRVTTDSAYTVVANGELVSRRRGGSRTTWTYAQAAPMATYLATVQLGRYAVHELAPQQLLVCPPHLLVRARHDVGRSPQMLTVFSELFGPYPFDSYTVVVTDDDLEIPLEAQGLSVLGANHVDGARRSERLVAHELAHQWFGNSLTAGRWQDVWLHEGFACYAEWLWSERSGGWTADRCARAAWTRLSALPQDLLLADPGPELMFDDRVYKRGALALHAVRGLVGDAVFFGLLRTWSSTHRHGTVTTTGFVAHCAGVGGPEAADLLSDWLDALPLPPLPPLLPLPPLR